MKRFPILLCLLLILTGCANSGPETIDHDPVPVDTVPEPDIVPANKERPLTEAYIASMEEYEVMEIVLLGTWTNDTLDQGIGWGYELISEIDQEHIVSGNMEADRPSLAYLLIPAEGLTLTIGRYDPLGNKISDVFFNEENAWPVIYIESASFMTPPSLISLRKDDLTMKLLTGLNDQGHLRTEYLMGIVDNTPYDKLDEISPYGETLKEILENSAPVAAEDIQEHEYMALVMDEMLYQGEMYLIYSVENYSGLPPYLYGIHYDPLKEELKYIISYDHESWTDPEKIVG